MKEGVESAQRAYKKSKDAEHSQALDLFLEAKSKMEQARRLDMERGRPTTYKDGETLEVKANKYLAELSDRIFDERVRADFRPTLEFCENRIPAAMTRHRDDADAIFRHMKAWTLSQTMECARLQAETGRILPMGTYALLLSKQGRFEDAFRWASRAAEEGDPWMQAFLARSYYNGDGTERDYELAARWAESSARQGWHDGLFILAVQSSLGHGVKRNLPAAVIFAKLAGAAGSEEGKKLAETFLDKYFSPDERTSLEAEARRFAPEYKVEYP